MAITKADRELQDIFMAFHQRLVVAWRKKLEDHNLSFPQVETVRFVIDRKSPSMKDIATYLGTTPPSATVMVEHLAKKKLIKRTANSRDRRAIHVLPTAKAKTLFDKFKKIKNEIFSQVLKDLNREDKITLTGLLKKIT